jgi:hypothetical protein
VAPEPDLDSLTRCFAAKVAAWFEHEGTVRLLATDPAQTVAALVAARQENMALALALSRWVEYAALSPREAISLMDDWLDRIEARAEARGAAARARAIAQARRWFESCRDASPPARPRLQ